MAATFQPRKFQDLDEKFQYSNRKAAWNECNKQLSKRPDDLTYQLWKASLLIRRDGQKEVALELLLALCRKQPPITSVPAIQQIHHLLAEASSKRVPSFTPEISQAIELLWTAAFKSVNKISSRQVAAGEFKCAMEYEQWDLALKAVQKLNPTLTGTAEQLRDYFLSVLVRDKMASTEQDPRTAQTLRSLGLMQVRRAIDHFRQPQKIPGLRSDKGALSVISSIYMRHEQYSELLKFLDDFEILSSNYADPELMRMKLNCLNKLGQWEELVDNCKILLESVSSADDVQVWLQLCSAYDKVDQQRRDAIFNLLGAHRSRSAWLARIAKIDVSLDLGFDDETARIAEYVLSFGHLNCCFNDVRGYLDEWGMDKAKVFLALVRKVPVAPDDRRRFLTYELNVLRFEYFLLLSPGQSNTVAQGFIGNCLRFCDLCKGDKFLACDAKILAVMALTPLHPAVGTSQPFAYWFQALLLIHEAVDTCQDHGPARQLAIWMTMGLGFAKEAVQHFLALGIKESMFDSLSHILFERLSSISPCLGTDQNVLDQQIIRRSDRFYKKTDERLSQVLGDCIQGAHSSQLLDLADFHERIRHSSTREMFRLQAKVIARFNNNMDLHAIFDDRQPQSYHDNRDLETMPNFERRTAYTKNAWKEVSASAEEDESTALSALTRASLLARQTTLDAENPYFRFYWLADDTWKLLLAKEAVGLEPVAAVELDREHSTDQLTPTEWRFCQGWKVLIPLVNRIILGTPISGNAKDNVALPRALQTLRVWIKEHCRSPSPGELPSPTYPLPTWQSYQCVFLTLDFLRASEKLRSVAERRFSELSKLISRKDLQSIKEEVDARHKSLKDWALAWKTYLDKEGWETLITQAHQDPSGDYICNDVLGEKKARNLIVEMKDRACQQLQVILDHKL